MFIVFENVKITESHMEKYAIHQDIDSSRVLNLPHVLQQFQAADNDVEAHARIVRGALLSVHTSLKRSTYCVPLNAERARGHTEQSRLSNDNVVDGVKICLYFLGAFAAFLTCAWFLSSIIRPRGPVGYTKEDVLYFMNVLLLFEGLLIRSY